LIEGGFFTRDFLIEGITSTQQSLALDEVELARIRATADALFSKLTAIKSPSEAVTEKDLIYPLLSAVGWGDRVLSNPTPRLCGGPPRRKCHSRQHD
jgi:hypothetical protein